jgi:hypothetical protein
MLKSLISKNEIEKCIKERDIINDKQLPKSWLQF